MKTPNHSFVLLSLITALAFIVSVTPARAAGCSPGCSMQMASAEHDMSAMQSGDKTGTRELMPPLPTILDNYAKIQASLAADKLDGVPNAAQAISKLIAGDEMKMLPAEVATRADALAKSKDLATAREAFKGLSASLISYLGKTKAQTGRYYEVYCPMAKASWLQTDKTVKNPYFGASMSHCGEIKRVF